MLNPTFLALPAGVQVLIAPRPLPLDFPLPSPHVPLPPAASTHALTTLLSHGAAWLQGVPFLMALVIGHMAINGLLLIISLVQQSTPHTTWTIRLEHSVPGLRWRNQYGGGTNTVEAPILYALSSHPRAQAQMAREHRAAAQKQKLLEKAVSSASGTGSTEVVRQVYERAFERYQASTHARNNNLLEPT